MQAEGFDCQVTSFRYYGEVVDPELTNMLITTVGVGATWPMAEPR